MSDLLLSGVYSVTREQLDALAGSYKLTSTFDSLGLRGGLYILRRCNENLYVGWSNDLASRVRSHVLGITNTKRFSEQIDNVVVMSGATAHVLAKTFEQDYEDVELAFIKQLGTRYNVQNWKVD